MRGYRTHFIATAYHEAGHALAAMYIGRDVPWIHVDVRDPRNGLTRFRRPAKNPHRITGASVEADSAWQHTLATHTDELFVLLAGPLAESKLTGTPLRLLGNQSDLEQCLKVVERLQNLSEVASAYTPTGHIEMSDLLESTRRRTRRWVGQPRVWTTISMVAHGLTERGHLDAAGFAVLIGRARQKGGQLAFGRGSEMASSGPQRSKRRDTSGRVKSSMAEDLAWDLQATILRAPFSR